jgi:hypothetical protein
MADNDGQFDVKRQFHRNRVISWTLSLILVPVIGAGEQGFLPITVSLAAMIALFIPLLVLWRCPACQRSLGRNLFPERCQYCGAAFQ